MRLPGLPILVRFGLKIILIYFISQSLLHWIPGDPVQLLIEEAGLPYPPETLRAELGLNRPLLEQIRWNFSERLQGNWGVSLVLRKPVLPLWAHHFWHTLQLTGLAFFLSVLLSILIGTLAANPHPSRLQKYADYFCTALGLTMASVPKLWLCSVLILVLVFQFPVFDLESQWALPVVALTLGYTGLWSRFVRARVRENWRIGPITGARARGLPEWRVFYRYGWMPVSASLWAYFFMQVGQMLGGSFIVENLFNIPGIGTLMVNAVLSRDYPVIQTSIFFTACTVLVFNQIGDWIQGWIDPRIASRPNNSFANLESNL